MQIYIFFYELANLITKREAEQFLSTSLNSHPKVANKLYT